MKAAGQAPPAAEPAAAPAAVTPSASEEAPRRGGYLPPHLRNRDGGDAPASGGWRERENSGRGSAGRESPAASSGRYEPPSSRGGFRSREEGGAGGYVPPGRRGTPQDGSRESESLPTQQSSGDGKYRPGAFRRGGQ